MESRRSKGPLRFGVFELDLDSGELRRHGLKVRLPDQSFQILKLLLGRAGEVIGRDELRNALWTSDTFVDFEVGLNSAVRKLREALDDSADNPRFVETVPRRGYRFIGSVTSPIENPVPPLEPPGGRGSSALGQTVEVDSPPVALMPVPPPRRIGVGRRGAALLFLGLVALFAFLYYRAAEPVSPPIQSLVVLPFEDLSGDQEQEYFADSVTDALTAHLHRPDSMSFRGRRHDAGAAATDRL